MSKWPACIDPKLFIILCPCNVIFAKIYQPLCTAYEMVHTIYFRDWQEAGNEFNGNFPGAFPDSACGFERLYMGE